MQQTKQGDVKQGDVVLYSAFGRSVNALVLAIRTGEVSHLGANGEPLLTVAFIDPAREIAIAPKKNNPAQPAGLPQIFTEHDVVHASHKFDEDFLDKHGRTQANIASQRGHGEWRELAAGENAVDAGGAGGDTLSDMTKAEQKDELAGMSKADLLESADQHGADASSSMNKGELVSSLKKKLKSDATAGN